MVPSQVPSAVSVPLSVTRAMAQRYCAMRSSLPSSSARSFALLAPSVPSAVQRLEYTPGAQSRARISIPESSATVGRPVCSKTVLALWIALPSIVSKGSGISDLRIVEADHGVGAIREHGADLFEFVGIGRGENDAHARGITSVAPTSPSVMLAVQQEISCPSPQFLQS